MDVGGTGQFRRREERTGYVGGMRYTLPSSKLLLSLRRDKKTCHSEGKLKLQPGYHDTDKHLRSLWLCALAFRRVCSCSLIVALPSDFNLNCCATSDLMLDGIG